MIVFANGVKSALTAGELAAIAAAEAAVRAAKAHPGGRLYGWGRRKARNTYTINPRRPEPDSDDLEKSRLQAAADAAVAALIEAGVESPAACRYRGWM